MSLHVTVVDEQTQETQTYRVATGSYAVVAAHPCYVDNAATLKEDLTTQIVMIKNFYPQTLPKSKRSLRSAKSSTL